MSAIDNLGLVAFEDLVCMKLVPMICVLSLIATILNIAALMRRRGVLMERKIQTLCLLRGIFDWLVSRSAGVNCTKFKI